MFRTDDPLADFYRHELEKKEMTADLPVCDYCGKFVDDHYYFINGEVLCEVCLDEQFRVSVEI